MSKPKKKWLDGVCRHKRELPMLLSVMDNPADENAKCIYSDWLQERGDPRGDFLQKFLTMIADNKVPPQGKKYNQTWRERVGVNLLFELSLKGLNRHREQIMKLAHPALSMFTFSTGDKRVPIGATKFGGRPHLPHSMEWPRCEFGALDFLGQINLLDLRDTMVEPYFPKDGLLLFFLYHPPQEPFIMDGINDPAQQWKFTRVIHLPHTAKLCPRRRPKDENTSYIGCFDNDPAWSVCQITYEEKYDLPKPDDFWQDQCGDFTDIINTLLDNDEYTTFQRHPETTFQLLGYAWPTKRHYDPIPGPDWQLLIRLGSDDAKNFFWDSDQCMFFYIRKDDLKKGNFENVFATLG